MKRSVAAFVGLLAPLLSARGADAAPPSPPAAVLRWNNGESLSGEVLDASATAPRWKSPLFEGPLELRWDALRRIDRTLPASETAEQFSIVLRDGRHLFGNVVELTSEALTIRSSRHGDAALKRSEVLAFRRVRGGNVVFAGPTGDAGWEEVTEGKQGDAGSLRPEPGAAQSLTVGTGGALVFRSWNRGAELRLTNPKPEGSELRAPVAAPSDVRLSIEPGAKANDALKVEISKEVSQSKRKTEAGETLPEVVDVESRVRSSVRPKFRLSIGGGTSEGIKLETWDDELVLAGKDQFKTIGKLKEDEREISLRLLWNCKERRCSVFTPAGEPIIEWQAPDGGTPRGGLALHNKGRDLTLEFLRVRRWDGNPPPKTDLEQPRVELANGRVLEGEIANISADTLSVRASEQRPEFTLPLADVDAVIFSTQGPQTTDTVARLSFVDGTLLHGSINGVHDGQVTLKTNTSEQPVRARIDGLRQLLSRVPGPADAMRKGPVETLDRLVLDDLTMQGKITGVGDDQLRWMPVGGVVAVKPSRSARMEIARAQTSNVELPSGPALFYTNTGDVLPGKLRSLDRSGAKFESDLVEVTKLPAASLDAIQFGGAPQLNIDGFTDAGWRVLKGDEKSVRKTVESVRLEPGTAVGHPSVMQSSELKFAIEAGSYATVRLRLFCAGTDATQATHLLLSSWGNRVQAGVESSNGSIEDLSESSVAAGRAVTVRLVFRGKQVELHINGAISGRVPIELSKRGGVGLVVEPAGMLGSQVSAVTLSGFSARSEPGGTWLPEVNHESKIHALTVPRFRSDDLPRHALLARNGDVLRGEIEATTPTHFSFEQASRHSVSPGIG